METLCVDSKTLQTFSAPPLQTHYLGISHLSLPACPKRIFAFIGDVKLYFFNKEKRQGLYLCQERCVPKFLLKGLYREGLYRVSQPYGHFRQNARYHS